MEFRARSRSAEARAEPNADHAMKVALIFALTLIVAGALDIRRRGHRSPHAHRAMIALAGCYFVVAVLTVAWLLLPSLCRAQVRTSGPIAAPGTAGVEPRWLLMEPPLRPLPIPPGSPPGVQTLGPDTTASLSRWKIVKTFPTERKCHAQAGNTWVKAPASPGVRSATAQLFTKSANLRCVASNDPHLKAVRLGPSSH
jgi:hypothetical protein